MGRNYRIVAIALAALSLTACHSSNPVPVPGGNDAEFPSPPLDSSSDPDSAGLGGQISVSGLTLEAEAGHGTSAGGGFTNGPGGGSGPGSIGQPGVTIRVVDPGDDILKATVTDANGRYSLALTGTQLVKLQVQLKVAEDVNGDGSGGDTIIQTVPLSLVKGKSAVVNMVLSRGTAAQADGEIFPPAGSPDGGELIVAELHQEDGNGFKDDFFGTLPATGEMVFDRDGDHFLQRGPDPVYADADKNGWPDPSETAYSDPAAMPLPLSGTINSVSIAKLTMTLLLDDGSVKTIIIDPFTTIQQLSADRAFLGELTFDTSLVGRQAQISCLDTPSGVVAGLVLVLDSQSLNK